MQGLCLITMLKGEGMTIRQSVFCVVMLLIACNDSIDASGRRDRRAIHYTSANEMSHGCAAQVENLCHESMMNSTSARTTGEAMEVQEMEIEVVQEAPVSVSAPSKPAKPIEKMTHDMKNKIMENKKPHHHACNDSCSYHDHQLAALELTEQARDIQKKAVDFQRQALQHRRQINEAHDQINQAKEVAQIHKDAEIKMQEEAIHFIKLSKNIEKQSMEHLESMATGHQQV